MNGFIQMCKKDPDTYDFGKYFEGKYAKMPEKWAMCKRKGIGLTTNMYLEAMHKALKYIFLDGRKNRRVDKLIAALLKLCRRLICQRIYRYVKKKPTSRMQVITERHKAKDEVKVIEVISENKWLVKSVALTRGPYTVEIFPEKRCDVENCPLDCPICKLCVHQISCTCLDYEFRLNFCKHAHACIMKTNLPWAKKRHHFNEDVKLDEFQQGVMPPTATPNLAETISMRDKFAATMERIQGVAMQLRPEEMEEACGGAEKLLTNLMKIINLRSNDKENGDEAAATEESQVPQFDSVSSPTPHNAKVDKQFRFKSTKNKLSLNRRPRTAMTKPGDIQREVLSQIFVNESYHHREFISIQSQQDSDHQY